MILPIPTTFGPFQSSDINSSRQGGAVEDFAGNGGPSLKRNSRPWHFFEVQAVVAPLLHCVTLLDANASLLTTWSADGFAPIHLAAHFGHVAAVRLLVERGAPIDAKSRNWLIVRPLQSATAGRRLPVVELLLKVGANVNERQSGKWTALHSAAQHGDVAIVMEFRRHGADRTALNAEGKNAARIAREAGHNELATTLEGHRSIEEVGK
jgi:uncharacterized protein